MTDQAPSPPLNNSSVLYHHHHHSHHLHEAHHDSSIPPSFHPNGKMRLGKAHSSPVGSGDLPPLIGVPHVLDKDRFIINHQHQSVTAGDPITAVPPACHGVSESETPTGPAVAGPSPLMRRRLKYMVRQCSDSELLKINSGLGRLKLAGGGRSASPAAPHPPDHQSPRSRDSSDTDSPRVLRKPQRFNSPRTGAGGGGTGRQSRSLDASPMAVRRCRNGVRRHSGDQDSSLQATRPYSFGSYTDVLQCAGSGGDPSAHQALTASPVGPGSPFVAKRTVSLRGGVLPPPSRPDTPANDALSLSGSRKSTQLATSSGERNDAEEDEPSYMLEEGLHPDEIPLPRRTRSRRDSGSHNAQRNSSAPSGGVLVSPADCSYRSLLKKAAGADNQWGEEYPLADHVVVADDDDTGYPSDLYDIQERRESILSIEAVQEIARRFANTGPDADSDDRSTAESDAEADSRNEDEKKKKMTRCKTKDKVPDYRKEPLPTDTRVSNWLKGIQDPTEGVPTNLGRILPDII